MTAVEGRVDRQLSHLGLLAFAIEHWPYADAHILARLSRDRLVNWIETGRA